MTKKSSGVMFFGDEICASAIISDSCMSNSTPEISSFSITKSHFHGLMPRSRSTTDLHSFDRLSCHLWDPTMKQFEASNFGLVLVRNLFLHGKELS